MGWSNTLKFRILSVIFAVFFSSMIAEAKSGKSSKVATTKKVHELKTSVSNTSNKTKPEEEFERSIVQIKVSFQEPDYISPWKKKNPRVRRGVGIVVDGDKILLPAQILQYSTLVEIKKFSSYADTKATIFRIDPETNLALLKVDEKGFFQDLKPLEFQTSISYPKQISIYQLDNSGSIQSATGALLSLDLDLYPQGQIELPILDVNSTETLNGNGEVIVENGKVGGILFDFSGDKNAGRAIPSFLIRKFLGVSGNSQIAYKGFRHRPVTDEATKTYYGINGKNEGILVAEILPGSSADGVLKPGDVILEFGGKKIDSKGYFEHPTYGKQVLSFIAHIGDEFGYEVGKKIPVSILREKKKMEVNLPLKPFPYSSIRIPHRDPSNRPDFYLDGGFLFIDLSENYLLEWGKDWRSRIDKKLLYLYDYHKFRSSGDNEGRIVLLSQVVPDESNNGYHEVFARILESVEGVPVLSVKDLMRKVKESKKNFISLLLDDGTEVILNKAELANTNARINAQYKIPLSTMGERK
ncbi:S1C family serine protease [Leptospira inadai]|uniref:S1C family serine protease n=1 Tax=Leptospira inadai TaxID=29506 RepID=UPI000A9F3166